MVYNEKLRLQLVRNGMEEVGQAGDKKTTTGPAAEVWSCGAHCKLSNISGLHCSGRCCTVGIPDHNNTHYVTQSPTMPRHYDQSPLTDDNSSLIALCLHPRLRRVRQQQRHSSSVNVHQAVFLHRRFFPHTQNRTTTNHWHFLIRLKSGNQCFLVNVK